MLVVDLPQLQAAIAHMAAYGTEVEACLADIERTMAVLRASWHGSGSEAQAQAQQQWQDGANQMQEALTQLTKIADTAQKNYNDAVEKNGQMWAR